MGVANVLKGNWDIFEKCFGVYSSAFVKCMDLIDGEEEEEILFGINSAEHFV